MSGGCTAARVGLVAASDPHRLAVHDDDGPVSYADLHHRLQRCAQWLARAGLQAGDRVAVGGTGLARQLLPLLAAEGLGAVTASFGSAGDEAAQALFRHVQWVVAGTPQAVPDGVRFLLLDETVLAGLRQPLEGPAIAWADLPADAPVRLARTSGSTGPPKFLLHPRAGHDWWIDYLLQPGLVQGPESRLLVLCPLLVGGAYSRVSAGLRSGGAVLGGAQLDLDRLRPNLVLGLSVHVERFLDALPPGARLPAPVATVILGGAVPLVLRRRLAATLRGAVENTYGSNECGPVAAQSGAGEEGALVPKAEVRILDDAGRALPMGELGTIALRTPVVGRGYLGDEAASAAYRDGWFVTSDVGILVRPGVLRVLGRRDDLLVIGGLKVPAGFLEERLAGVPSLASAAVLSVQLDGGKSTLGVAVVLARGATPAQVQADLSRVLADVAAVGIRFVTVNALPRLPGGKIDRAALLRLFLALKPS
jgi:acyl-coenzyme A synthetase/AMP-(fatty) acid ligase